MKSIHEIVMKLNEWDIDTIRDTSDEEIWLVNDGSGWMSIEFDVDSPPIENENSLIINTSKVISWLDRLGL